MEVMLNLGVITVSDGDRIFGSVSGITLLHTTPPCRELVLNCWSVRVTIMIDIHALGSNWRGLTEAQSRSGN